MKQREEEARACVSQVGLRCDLVGRVGFFFPCNDSLPSAVGRQGPLLSASGRQRRCRALADGSILCRAPLVGKQLFFELFFNYELYAIKNISFQPFFEYESNGTPREKYVGYGMAPLYYVLDIILSVQTLIQITNNKTEIKKHPHF